MFRCEAPLLQSLNLFIKIRAFGFFGGGWNVCTWEGVSGSQAPALGIGLFESSCFQLELTVTKKFRNSKNYSFFVKEQFFICRRKCKWLLL